MPDAGQSLTASELELLHPSTREQYLDAALPAPRFGTQPSATLMVPRLLVAFVKSGGLLVLGSNPGGCCGYGHFAGVSNHNAVVRLAQFGFSPLEVIRIATMNGATFLGIADRTGSIAIGKEADLLVVRGDPSVRIEDIKQIETVFSNGLQHDPNELLAQVNLGAGWFVILDVSCEQALEPNVVADDHVVETLASDRSDEPFVVAIASAVAPSPANERSRSCSRYHRGHSTEDVSDLLCGLRSR